MKKLLLLFSTTILGFGLNIKATDELTPAELLATDRAIQRLENTFNDRDFDSDWDEDEFEDDLAMLPRGEWRDDSPYKTLMLTSFINTWSPKIINQGLVEFCERKNQKLEPLARCILEALEFENGPTLPNFY